MGDISEIRGLVVIGTFLTIVFLIIGWISSAFYTLEEGRLLGVSEFFESSELVHWNATYTISIADEIYGEYWGKEEFGHDMYFFAFGAYGEYYMENTHGYRFWGEWTGGHRMNWINEQGINRGLRLFAEEIEKDWDPEKKLASYIVKCKHFYIRADIGYNTSLYSTLTEAWDAKDLHVLFGINWEQRGTTWDAWSLIANIWFFRGLDVNPYVNALIAIPIWIAIAYLSFILVLRALGAFFGGGA